MSLGVFLMPAVAKKQLALEDDRVAARRALPGAIRNNIGRYKKK
jgi:hypothetical protein